MDLRLNCQVTAEIQPWEALLEQAAWSAAAPAGPSDDP